ncbi:Phytoene synthase, chloroplastic [Seminavis robusta]|uniref:15-cis-phytoene synthase n=1 Tax=Seminavis robusta TaxID=568900 RepID=A0A9N8DPQ9_9STRA|nr:Phytoene synthase, chloroplastic [Seminavis robusta]|eukprot:Sro202_g085340.1 Phytoene synthase, chloroplastic (261) ;mRNA; f:24078-24970
MAQHDPILLYVSRLLDPQTAADAAALYAWCRRLDEIVDTPDDNSDNSNTTTRAQLEEWQDRLDQLWDGRPVDAMDAALYQCLQRQQLDRTPFDDMIAGMMADTVNHPRRIATMADLEEYGYQVAGTVGLMLLPLLNANNTTLAQAPAIALGQAIQLINILRDATPDGTMGRIYLPQDLLQAKGVLESDILAGQSSPQYQAVVQQVAHRAEELLQAAERGKQCLPGLGPLLVQIIVELYRGYLDQLERPTENASGSVRTQA